MSDCENRRSARSDLGGGNGFHPEVERELLRVRTRRHFLRTLGSGLGTVFMGTLATKFAGGSATAGVTAEGAAPRFHPRSHEPAGSVYRRSFRRRCSGSFICTWLERQASWNSSNTSLN